MFGIAIVALPAGIITAGYMTEIEKEKAPTSDKVDAPKIKEKDENHD